MIKLKRIIATILLAAGLTVLTAPLAFADAASECAAAGHTSTQASAACIGGYNNGASFCSNMTNQQLVPACQAGVSLAQAAGGGGQQQQGNNSITGGSASSGGGECGGTKTGIISCQEGAGLGAIGAIIKMGVVIMTILIGIISVGAIGYAAVLYASARDNQSQVQNAIGIIRNVVIGLILYAFTVAIINWLIPGAVIG